MVSDVSKQDSTGDIAISVIRNNVINKSIALVSVMRVGLFINASW